jgi:hypothetical protein
MTFAKTSRVRGLALAAALACAPRAHAQGAQEALAAATRVRIAADSGHALTGNVLRLNADTLTITASAGGPLPIPLSRLTSLEVSRGRNRAGWSLGGALIGGLVGGVLGGASGGHDDPTGLGAGAGFAAGGILGLLSGAVVGALVAPERWRAVPLPTAAR